MIPIAERVTVKGSREAVWSLLRDPALVVSCIPGAEFGEDKGGGLYAGRIAVSFGPVKAHFAGEAQLRYDEEAFTCQVSGRGQDQRGASRATANATIHAIDGGQTTELKIDGGFDVNGPLATFARAGGVHVARQLLAEFAANISERAEVRDVDRPIASQQTNTVSGFRLLWRIVVNWLRGFAGPAKTGDN